MGTAGATDALIAQALELVTGVQGAKPRGVQGDIIQTLLRGHDALCIGRTGGGKTGGCAPCARSAPARARQPRLATWGRPSRELLTPAPRSFLAPYVVRQELRLHPGVTAVVVPLIALARQQARHPRRGVPAVLPRSLTRATDLAAAAGEDRTRRPPPRRAPGRQAGRDAALVRPSLASLDARVLSPHTARSQAGAGRHADGRGGRGDHVARVGRQAGGYEGRQRAPLPGGDDTARGALRALTSARRAALTPSRPACLRAGRSTASSWTRRTTSSRGPASAPPSARWACLWTQCGAYPRTRRATRTRRALTLQPQAGVQRKGREPTRRHRLFGHPAAGGGGRRVPRAAHAGAAELYGGACAAPAKRWQPRCCTVTRARARFASSPCAASCATPAPRWRRTPTSWRKTCGRSSAARAPSLLNCGVFVADALPPSRRPQEVDETAPLARRGDGLLPHARRGGGHAPPADRACRRRRQPRRRAPRRHLLPREAHARPAPGHGDGCVRARRPRASAADAPSSVPGRRHCHRRHHRRARQRRQPPGAARAGRAPHQRERAGSHASAQNVRTVVLADGSVSAMDAMQARRLSVALAARAPHARTPPPRHPRSQQEGRAGRDGEFADVWVLRRARVVGALQRRARL